MGRITTSSLARIWVRIVLGAAIAWGAAGTAALAQDWGDAPDTYQTTNASGGPSHVLNPNLWLGISLDSEADGVPGPNADGDDTAGLDDEDGVTAATLVAGTNGRFVVTVLNNTGAPARLLTWIDVNGSAAFDAGELNTTIVASSPTLQSILVSIPLPPTTDIDTGGSTYARFRLTTSGAVTTPGGAAPDGEVEDYRFSVNPPGVGVSIANNLARIPRGSAVTYQATVEYSGLTGITRTIDIPMNPASFNGVTWTCVANANASCITGQPLGTGASGVGAVNRSIDLTQGGAVTFTVNGVLRPDYAAGNLAVTASVNSGETATDMDGVVAAVPVVVPTLGEWAMLAFLALLAAFGVARLPRRRAA